MSSSGLPALRRGLFILQGQAAAALLPRPPRRAVTPLVVADDLRPVLRFGRPPQTLQPAGAQVIQTETDLLRRPLRIFPPAGPPPGRLRTSALANTTSGVASVPCNCDPRSGGNPTRSFA